MLTISQTKRFILSLNSGNIKKEIKTIQGYEKPYDYFHLEKEYPRLLKDPVHFFRAITGIEVIHKEPSTEEFVRISQNWERMTDYLKEISDRFSVKVFGLTNVEHYKKLKEEYNL